MAATTDAEISASIDAYANNLISRAISKLKANASEPEVIAYMKALTPPSLLTKNAIDTEAIATYALHEAEKIIPPYQPSQILIGEIDVNAVAPAPPTEALQRISILRDQVAELEKARFSAKKDVVMGKIARLEATIAGKDLPAIRFTLPSVSDIGSNNLTEGNINPIPSSTSSSDAVRIAQAAANLAASHPELSSYDVVKLATQAVTGSFVDSQGNTVVVSDSIAASTSEEMQQAGAESIGTVTVSGDVAAIQAQISDQEAQLKREQDNTSYSPTAKAYIVGQIQEVIRQLKAQLPL